MSKIGDNIRSLRYKKRMTLEELGNLLGVNRQTIYKYEKGIVENIPLTTVQQMAKIFGVSPLDLIGWEDVEPVRETDYIEIPVFGSIACGEPIEAFNDVTDYTTIPSDWAKGGQEYFCLTAKGDSMSPVIEDGDIAVIRKQPDCENGQVCAIFVNGYDATLKRVYKDNGVLTLQAINTGYPPQTFTDGDEVKVLGVMIELRKRFY